MDRYRLARGLGWLSVGLGLTELLFAEGICRRLGMRRRSGLVRAMGVRELVTGVGLLRQQNQGAWLLGRVVGDAIDLSLLGATFAKPAPTLAWRVGATLAVAGVTLVDVLAVAGSTLDQMVALGSLDLLDVSGAPVESWRGSGLAEDVGVRQREAAAEIDELERQRRMNQAQRQLGLPDPDPRLTRH